MRFTFAFCIFALCLTACKSDYEKLVDAEIAKGVKNDEFILNMHFGMPQKAFFDTCWALNQIGTLSHGTELPTTTRLDVSKYFSHTVYMNFFGDFKDGKVDHFFAIFVYKDWAPWLKDLSQEKLLQETLRYFELQFPGNSFLEVNNPEKGKRWVKVDGNRQILVFPHEEQKVKALITDLTKQ